MQKVKSKPVGRVSADIPPQTTIMAKPPSGSSPRNPAPRKAKGKVKKAKCAATHAQQGNIPIRVIAA